MSCISDIELLSSLRLRVQINAELMLPVRLIQNKSFSVVAIVTLCFGWFHIFT